MTNRSVLGGVLILAATSCAGGLDPSPTAPISNDDTYAMMSYIWDGARAAIVDQRDPDTGQFSLPLNHSGQCPGGGQRSYQGTLTGANNNGTGSATLTLTATLTQCVFEDLTHSRTISASGVSISGPIIIASDAYANINLRLTATTVTINGVNCPGGVNVTLSGPSPSSQPTATGTACGRTGSVPLP